MNSSSLCLRLTLMSEFIYLFYHRKYWREGRNLLNSVGMVNDKTNITKCELVWDSCCVRNAKIFSLCINLLNITHANNCND